MARAVNSFAVLQDVDGEDLSNLPAKSAKVVVTCPPLTKEEEKKKPVKIHGDNRVSCDYSRSRTRRLNWDLVAKRLDEMERGIRGVDSAVDLSGDKKRCSMVDIGKKLDRLVAQHNNNHGVRKERSSSVGVVEKKEPQKLCNGEEEEEEEEDDDDDKGKEKPEFELFALPLYLKARYIELGISVEGLIFIDDKDYYDQRKYYHPELSKESLQIVNGQLVYSFKGYEHQLKEAKKKTFSKRAAPRRPLSKILST